jgi:four helix bundle suffix protein
VAQLVYDVTVRFCDRYIDKRSRTHDQMVQAARSGVQNIAEGSQASGTSKKFELKLTNVARASLEELRCDYQDFLRQRGLPLLSADDPVLLRFKAKRCASMEDVRAWVAEERDRGQDDIETREVTDTRTDTDEHGLARTGKNEGSMQAQASVPVSDRPCLSNSMLPSSVLAVNAALSLINLCCYLLDRQVAAQAEAFEKDGGFTERLYRTRKGNQ